MRGAARPDSDVDVVVLTSNQAFYLNDLSWAESFGSVVATNQEHYDPVKSMRVHYDGGLEVEFAFAPLEWADTQAADDGTLAVVSAGMVILADKSGRLAALQRLLSQASRQAH